MAFIKYLFGLQLFAEGGGDGGASAGGGSASAGTETSGGAEIAYPDNIPERAKKYYEKAVKKTQKVDTATETAPVEEKTTTTEEKQETATTVERTNEKMSYKDLIKSDEYKEEHERHIKSVIKDRMRATNEILSLVAQKYGVDVNSKTFKDDLTTAIKADDSVYEAYAEEHDVSIDEARRMVGIEEQLKQANQEAADRKAEEEYNSTINALKKSAELTKAEYPDFNLDAMMKDDRYRRLVVAFGGDTTQAYEAINHKALQRRAVEEAEAKAQAAVQSSVRANRSRPHEGGLSSNSAANDGMPNFKAMNLAQLRQYAETHRKR